MTWRRRSGRSRNQYTVTEAFLAMKRFDLAALQRAYHGDTSPAVS